MVLAGRWQGEPVLVLVGMPNVGKSSIVTATSTGTPEINNYPFTTRGVTIGHVYDGTGAGAGAGRIVGQVMDTPGLLARADAERNEMEGLTLASMLHLPTAVIFVLDLTGHASDVRVTRTETSGGVSGMVWRAPAGGTGTK